MNEPRLLKDNGCLSHPNMAYINMDESSLHEILLTCKQKVMDCIDNNVYSREKMLEILSTINDGLFKRP
jgi:hypothetical protein